MNQYFELLKCGDAAVLASDAESYEADLDLEEFLKDEPLDQGLLTDAVNDCVCLAVLVHFGFIDHCSAKHWSGRGCDKIIEFFKQPHDEILENTSHLQWYNCYCKAYLLSCFCPQGMTARKAFSQFLQDDWQVEDAAIPIEPALGRIALLMASEHNDQLSQEINIRNAKPRWKKHAKSLLSAWNALKDGDQSRFVESLIEAVAEHTRKTKDGPNTPMVAIAFVESAMLGRAYEKGWTDLKFPPETAARLVTRQSLGLA
ncbi:MAG: hypothetical protein LC104_18335 [Bacteroidales bacterium]|nr:hypothetical protein [Bacteroidales bacterium]